MHSLAYQQGNKFSPTAMIYQNRREPDSKALNIDGIRAAVRAWAADCRSREFVAALIVEEWRETGGSGLDIPTDSHRQMQKVFRWIDGDTEYAANNIRQLTPAIMSVLPLEYRNRLAPQNDTMSLIATAMKECSEAKQAVLLNAPEHQKLKEVSEGIASLFRLMPEQVGPLMTMVTSMLGAM
ncbi:toxin YdaT domain-containing protein [Citrobacter farmeri]